MVFILFFLFVIMLIAILVLGFIFSKIVIDIEELNLNNKKDAIFEFYFNDLKVNVRIIFI